MTTSVMSLSSALRIWPRNSTTVTFVPSLVNAWANSIPMGPAPMTTIDAGSLPREKISLLVM